jgi:hypothetical protein
MTQLGKVIEVIEIPEPQPFQIPHADPEGVPEELPQEQPVPQKVEVEEEELVPV